MLFSQDGVATPVSGSASGSDGGWCGTSVKPKTVLITRDRTSSHIIALIMDNCWRKYGIVLYRFEI